MPKKEGNCTVTIGDEIIREGLKGPDAEKLAKAEVAKRIKDVIAVVTGEKGTKIGKAFADKVVWKHM